MYLVEWITLLHVPTFHCINLKWLWALACNHIKRPIATLHHHHHLHTSYYDTMSEEGEILDPKLKLVDPHWLHSFSKVSELLDDTNWTTWKDQTWHVFQFGKLHSIMNGTMARPVRSHMTVWTNVAATWHDQMTSAMEEGKCWHKLELNQWHSVL